MADINLFPATRYQGSKRKLLPWIWSSLQHMEFDSCLDLFSGTASVAYLLKTVGKAVTTNDNLQFNAAVARALVVNENVRIDPERARKLLATSSESYDDFIARTFTGIFYLDEENRWLDVVVQNIHRLTSGLERDVALFGLYQACLAKRPYNLFHRANLYMRTATVERRFGNKATWDKPFEMHFLAAIAEANASVFASGKRHEALCTDFREMGGAYDLVYVDPPYISARGTGVDYREFYHFLEGLTEYDEWPSRITTRYKHKPYARVSSPWASAAGALDAFDAILAHFAASIVVISYRSDGLLRIAEIARLLEKHGRRDARARTRDYKYVLSPAAGEEVLFVSEPPSTARSTVHRVRG